MADNISSFNSFTFIGTLNKNEDFYEEYITKGLYDVIKIKYSIRCGNNRHLLESVEFKPKDSNTLISLFNKDGSSKKIPFKDRINVDTGDLGFNHNSYQEIGSDKIKFAHGIDFIEKIKSMFTTEKYKGRKYKITGNVKHDTYIDKAGQERVITKYIPRHIVEVPFETEDSCTLNLKLYLLENCINRYDDVAILEGESVERTKDGYRPITMKIELPLGSMPDRAYSVYKNMYRNGTEYLRKVGIRVEAINGTQEVEFTEDMLTEDEKIRIELGIDTFEGIKVSKGKGIGEKERKFVRICDLRGYSEGSIETALTLEDIGFKKSTYKEEQDLTPDSFNAIDDDELPF